VIRRALATALLAVAVGAAVGVPAAGPASAAPPTVAAAAGALVVPTDKGPVRGARADGVDNFLGIPYAAAPVGALRWRAPEPAAPWTGVRPATAYGARCAALASTNGPRSDA
jgi:hypothetical protein